MSGYPEEEISGRSLNAVSAIALGLGLMFGWGIGKSNAQDQMIAWTIEIAQGCEQSYRREGFSSVSECLEGTIAKAVEEQREEKRAEAGHPNQ